MTTSENEAWPGRLAILRCPATGQPLILAGRAEAERLAGRLQARPGAPFASSQQVLLRADHSAAYPVVDGMPILLQPEMLTTRPTTWDLTDARWAEAYEEMVFYNSVGTDGGVGSRLHIGHLKRVQRASAFPNPDWLDAAYDAAAQLDAYRHLAPIDGQRFAQLGGKGLHAVKALLAGASEAWLITPMINELRYGHELARIMGVADRFFGVVAVAEELPLKNGTFQRVYCGGCLHHMATEYMAPEVYRIMSSRGRFAAVEPWQTMLHRIGTKILGKREKGAACRPLDERRLSPLKLAFRELSLRQHAPVLRYAAIATQKASRRSLSPRSGLLINRIDNALPIPKRMGGSVAVLATRN